MWLFYYFNFERNYDVLKSKSPCILLNKNINFNKNETELKMENPTNSFRETNLVLQLKLELTKVERRHFLYRLFYPREFYLTFVFYLNV